MVPASAPAATLNGTPTTAGGPLRYELSYTAAPGESNHVVVEHVGYIDGAVVQISDIVPITVTGEGCMAVTAMSAVCRDYAGIDGTLGDRNDSFDALTLVFVWGMTGGSGDDRLTISNGSIAGGPGNDTLTGGLVQYGEGGDDLLVRPGTAVCGSGFDRAVVDRPWRAAPDCETVIAFRYPGEG